jgi:hypothetical protein
LLQRTARAAGQRPVSRPFPAADRAVVPQTHIYWILLPKPDKILFDTLPRFHYSLIKQARFQSRWPSPFAD